MILAAIQKLKSGECSVAAVCTNGKLYTESGSSVRPLFRIWSEHHDDLAGACVADKVIGKAAAVLLAEAKVAEVFGFLMSESGLAALKSHGVKASCGQLVPRIDNRSETDMCPSEKAVEDCGDLNGCVVKLKAFIADTPEPTFDD